MAYEHNKHSLKISRAITDYDPQKRCGNLTFQEDKHQNQWNTDSEMVEQGPKKITNHKNTSPYCLFFPSHVHTFCDPNLPLVLSHHTSKQHRPTFPSQQDTQWPKQRGWNFFWKEKEQNKTHDPIFLIRHLSLYIKTNIRKNSNCICYF